MNWHNRQDRIGLFAEILAYVAGLMLMAFFFVVMLLAFDFLLEMIR